MNRWRRIRWHALLALACLLLLFPTLWALAGSFKPAQDLYGSNPLPLHGTLANYQVAGHQFPLFRLLFNTLVTAALVTSGQIMIAILAAYALARLRFRGARVLMATVTIAVLVPAHTLIIPQFVFISRLHWVDSYPGLIVPQFGACALPVLLLRQNIRALPEELFSAAHMDGAGSFRILWHVVLPLLRPALSAVAILSFINTWNEYVWPMVAAPSPQHTTIQMGLTLFTNTEASNPGPLLAAAMLATLPVIAVYLVAARRITAAFLHSGLR
ncbi:carbohydrate ABC transporter permease [Spirillospora sp. CA-108201]